MPRRVPRVGRDEVALGTGAVGDRSGRPRLLAYIRKKQLVYKVQYKYARFRYASSTILNSHAICILLRELRAGK